MKTITQLIKEGKPKSEIIDLFIKGKIVEDTASADYLEALSYDDFNKIVKGVCSDFIKVRI